ncbi:hypothetical protein XM38_037990 [Halomicronema hongdechloris C2206]|uniref:Sulfotransferase family protein n=1 Tax=Halomicronema hongdechloris C2206 TaxID=1641165 RepID=A0A1Z3HR87_9CYAN|nr:sulfotransferase family protein [Halomicronema hongdechloris]ASC72839.1 hypothetical protein XM38_037990 [Halomicronema hongdechloris C2206]
MVLEVHPPREQLRRGKNEVVQRYFRWRIQGNPDPYRVLGRGRPYKILLVLGHMRSGSSLLTHILNANPAILGYGETHLKYRTEADFKRLLQRVYWRGQEFRTLQDLGNLCMPHDYVMDKLLHTNKILDGQILCSSQVYALFLLREPQRSLASILALKAHLSPEQVLAYYQERLATLVEYGRLINDTHRMLLLTHADLIHRTDAVFVALQRVLQTPTGFSERYEVLKTTGQRGVGDSEGNITAGRIVRIQRPLQQTLPSAIIHQGQIAFQQCCQQLSSLCTGVDGV